MFTVRDFWGNYLAWASSHKSYRPITSLSYRLQVLFDGRGVNSVSVKRSLHAFNVINFALVSIIFYLVCTQLEDVTNRDIKTKSTKRKYTLSLLAGVLFAVHPIHTEAVACLVGRCELLAGLFFLLSLSSHIKAYHSHYACTGKVIIDHRILVHILYTISIHSFLTLSSCCCCCCCCCFLVYRSLLACSISNLSLRINAM